MRQTKIVCTLGPASDNPATIRALIDAGMDVARFNFSHGSHEYHRDLLQKVREAADAAGSTIGAMADLQGPKIRTGKLKDGEAVWLETGDPFTITTQRIVGDAARVSTTYTELPRDVKPGNRIFLSDGILELQVDRVEDTEVHCIVVDGGTLGENKGINLPGVSVSAPALTPKDIEDLDFILGEDFDFIALSFVRSPEDVFDLKRRLADREANVSVVAKIERPEAIECFDEIVKAADAVMMARGDLGVEIPFPKVPQVQKRLIGICNDNGVPVITATQMLESMVHNVRPTRAEVADVANAIYDGTDAVMLSGETASGSHPVMAVRSMARIADEVDVTLAEHPSHERIVRMRVSAIRVGGGNFGDAIGQAVCRTAEATRAKRIVCFSRFGHTAALVARYRPSVPITVVTINPDIRNRCSLIWGVDSIVPAEPVHIEEMDHILDNDLIRLGLAERGDVVIVAGSVPMAESARTNTLKIHVVDGAALHENSRQSG